MIRPHILAVLVLIAGLLRGNVAARAEQTRKSDSFSPVATRASSKAAPGAAAGARVAILVPAPGAVFTGDAIPLEFTLVKGKRGEHVHAYVDGQLMGMFKSKRGTLTGISRGTHTLELRVAAEDHHTELDASDRVQFVVE